MGTAGDCDGAAAGMSTMTDVDVAIDGLVNALPPPFRAQARTLIQKLVAAILAARAGSP